MNIFLLKRILITIFLLVIYRIGNLIIAPGLQFDLVYRNFIASGFNNYSYLVKFTLFGSGIDKYLSATVLVLIAAIFSNKIRSLLVGESAQIRKLELIIIITTFVLLVVQSFALSVFMKSMRTVSGESIFNNSLFDEVIFIIVKVTGGMICVFIARAITRAGVINGVLAIILMDIYYNIRSSVYDFFNNKEAYENVQRLDQLIAVAFILITIVLSIIFILAKRDIEISDEKGKAVTDNLFFPIRLNTAGVLPLDMTYGILSIFNSIYALIGFSFAFSNLYYYLVFIPFCAFFAYLFSKMAFNPDYIKDTLQRYGYSHGENINSGGDNYLEKIYKTSTLASVLVISILALSPLIIMTVLNNSNHFLMHFTGITLLVICCAVIDVKNRFNSLSRLSNSMVEVAQFNTQLEAELFVNRLKKADISGLVINTRCLPQTGTLSLYEICIPSIPYFITHRYLGNGTVSVFVDNNAGEKAVMLFNDIPPQENSVENNPPGFQIDKDQKLKDENNQVAEDNNALTAKDRFMKAKRVAQRINKKFS